MKIIIEDKYLAKLVERRNRTGKTKFPHEVEEAFVRRVFQMQQASNTTDLRKIKSLHFEKLEGSNLYYSIRANVGWRIIFRIGKDGMVEVLYIEELNNHYG